MKLMEEAEVSLIFSEKIDGDYLAAYGRNIAFLDD